MDDLVVYEAYIDEGKITLIKDQALVYIATCTDFAEVKEWSDRAAALEAYATRKKNIEAMLAMRSVNLNAGRRMGQLLEDMKERGEIRQGDPSNVRTTDVSRTTLKDLGINRQRAHDMRRLANMPQEGFDHYVTTGERLRRPKNKLISTLSILVSMEKTTGDILETLKNTDNMNGDMRASIAYRTRILLETAQQLLLAVTEPDTTNNTSDSKLTLKVVS